MVTFSSARLRRLRTFYGEVHANDCTFVCHGNGSSHLHSNTEDAKVVNQITKLKKMYVEARVDRTFEFEPKIRTLLHASG